MPGARAETNTPIASSCRHPRKPPTKSGHTCSVEKPDTITCENNLNQSY